jgi:hypothetical protein
MAVPQPIDVWHDLVSSVVGSATSCFEHVKLVRISDEEHAIPKEETSAPTS